MRLWIPVLCHMIANDQGGQELPHGLAKPIVYHGLRWCVESCFGKKGLENVYKCKTLPRDWKASTTAAGQCDTQLCSGIYGQKRLDILFVRYIFR